MPSGSPTFHFELLLGACIVLGTLLSGCASSNSATSTSSAQQKPAPSASEVWTPSEATRRLRTAADQWEGTPHDLGGTSRRGVDCSGLVQSVYADRFNASVPRTTEQQVRTGTQVSRSALQPGDLVFFRPGWKKRHVGIYIADGNFLHASASSGVTVSSLDNNYWTEHWWQARRLLSLSDEDSDAAPASSPSSSSPPTRASW